MTDATPRISAPHLERFANRTVRLLGKVTQLRGQDATLDADGSVQLILNRVSHRFLRILLAGPPSANGPGRSAARAGRVLTPRAARNPA